MLQAPQVDPRSDPMADPRLLNFSNSSTRPESIEERFFSVNPLSSESSRVTLAKDLQVFLKRFAAHLSFSLHGLRIFHTLHLKQLSLLQLALAFSKCH